MTEIDITDLSISLDELHLQSTGRLSTAKVTLNAEDGQFTSDASKPTTAPILKQFDLLRLTVINDDGEDGHSRIMEIVTDIGQYGFSSSHVLILELEGRERNLSGVPFSGLFRNATHNEMFVNIMQSYDRQITSMMHAHQPVITTIENDLGDFNPNIFDFTYIDNCYDAVNNIVEQANLPVSAGGLGDRFAVFFEDTEANASVLNAMVISQGSRNADSIPTLQQNTNHPIISIKKLKQASTGTITIARGNPKTGTDPADLSKFNSRVEFYNYIRQYDMDMSYPADVYVSYLGRRYVSFRDVPEGILPTNIQYWIPIVVSSFVRNIQYSPFTIDKRVPLINGFSNPTGGFGDTFDNVAIMDSNGTINDTNTTRTVVLMRSNTSNVRSDNFKNKYLPAFGGNRRWIHGSKVLVDTSLGSVGGNFRGVDRNGKSYANNIAMYVVPDGKNVGEWVVVRETEEFDQVAVYSEGRTYEYNVAFVKSTPTTPNRNYPGAPKDGETAEDARKRGGTGTTFAWRDISGEFIGNDCFHQPLNVEQVDGLIPTTLSSTGENLNNPSGVPYKRNSGIRITFGYDAVQLTPNNRNFIHRLASFARDPIGEVIRLFANAVATTIATFITPQYTKMGWWFCFPTPYPYSTHGGISEEIGALYGGDINTLNRHRYFDLFNIRYTTTGKEGWTHDDSDDLSEITGVRFRFNFDMTAGGARIPFDGDIPFSYWLMDDMGTVWKSPKVLVRHLGESQDIIIEFGDLTPVYRARTPFGLANVIDNITLPELEINEQVFKDRIIYQGFQCEMAYDDAGRYNVDVIERIIKPEIWNAFLGTGGAVRIIGTIDAFAFIKTPIAISDRTSGLAAERVIIPAIQDYPNITNIEQLQRLADSNADIEQFQYEQYTVKQQGITDLDLEDSVNLVDDLVPGTNKTVKLAVREIKYTSTRAESLVRELVLVRKIS